MATHPAELGRASALPLSVVLESLSSYPRPILRRLVARMIDQLDERDGDPDLEEDDPGGGAVDDEGEREEPDGIGGHGLDQRDVSHWGGSYRIE